MDVQPCAKKKKNSIIALFNLDITDSVLRITFGMPIVPHHIQMNGRNQMYLLVYL